MKAKRWWFAYRVEGGLVYYLSRNDLQEVVWSRLFPPFLFGDEAEARRVAAAAASLGEAWDVTSMGVDSP